MSARRNSLFYGILSVAMVGLFLSACGGGESETIYPDDQYRRTGTSSYDKASADGRLFGTDGFQILGGSGKQEPGAGGSGIGVNAFLWRASLDTLSFMPLASADPFGGVIITEWHTPPEADGERFKINIFILGRELRADGVRATVFRQVRDGTGAWADAPVAEATGTDLENAILTRARQLRIASAE
jgi:hypothetical protein